MAVYIVAQLRFTDEPSYRRYQSRFMDVFRKFKGRVLAADESPQVLEGEWPRGKVVMLSFPDEAAAREFNDSPEYAEIAVDRRKGADAVVLMVKGL
jgi:uncharacterized protein (DUF1330 family)